MYAYTAQFLKFVLSIEILNTQETWHIEQQTCHDNPPPSKLDPLEHIFRNIYRIAGIFRGVKFCGSAKNA